jgi:hypothetical protein
LPAMDTTTSSRRVVHPPPLDVTGLASKHRRSQTEYAPASAIAESDDATSPVLAHSPSEHTMSVRVSSRRSAARRGRVATSVFESPTTKPGEVLEEADALRARMEALRSEMGDGWLKVLRSSTRTGAEQRAGVSG